MSRPFILVIAGVNGAGKSSLIGQLATEMGVAIFNPDEMARELSKNGIPTAQANSEAWSYGVRALRDSISHQRNFAFETTLGGNSITAILSDAASTHDVIMLFCGLSSVDQHLERVSLRVRKGGHDIPEAKIRERWVKSRQNLIQLMPFLAHLQLFDNSATVEAGQPIQPPALVMEMAGGLLLHPDPQDGAALATVPSWARPLVEAALELTPR